jgi:hypothetical protein
MPITEVRPAPETHPTQTSVRLLLKPVRQPKLPVDSTSPPIGICALRAACKASVCHNDREDPSLGSRGH